MNAGSPPPRIGPIIRPADRFAREVVGWALRSRPREWPWTADDLARRAEEDAGNRDLLLYYAAAVARDLGDDARADALLARALEAGPAELAWRQEHELQLALADALVRGDPAAARARLSRLPPHETEPAYPLLAEAAALLGEGRRRDAIDALDRWRMAARASRTGRLEVGNLWALELLDERLGGRRAPAVARHGIVVVRHGALARAVMVLLGVPFAGAFGALAAFAIATLAKGAARGPLRLSLERALLVALLAAAAAYGCGLVVRGVRGTSRTRPGRSARLEAWLEAGLRRVSGESGPYGIPVLVLVAGATVAGGPGAFARREGPWVAAGAWWALAVWLALWVQVALHEAGHAAGALLAGGRVREIAVGPVRLFRDGRRLRWGRRPSTLFPAGHCDAALPGAPHAPGRYLLHVAGGPAASAAMLAACVALLAASAADRVGAGLSWAGAVAAAWGLFVSVVPSGPRARPNDARLALDALRGRFWYGELGRRLSAHVDARRRAREWDASAEEIERAAREAPDGGGWGLLLASARALDGGDPAIARRLLAEMLEDGTLDAGLRNDALLQAALVAALLDGDAAAARARIAEARAANVGAYATLAEAAAALAEDRRAEAAEALAAWSAAADAAEDPAYVRIGNHWALDAIAARLDAPGAAIA